MDQTLPFESFETRFEDVDIFVHKLEANYFYEALTSDALTAYVGVWHSMAVHDYRDGKNIIGELIIMFRNQGKEIDKCLSIKSTISATSESDNDENSVFCKLVQYLFDWVNNYLAQNNSDFVLPSFHYSKSHFRLRLA